VQYCGVGGIAGEIVSEGYLAFSSIFGMLCQGMPEENELIQVVLIASGITSIVFALGNVFRKLEFLDRIFPLGLQLILIWCIGPIMHGWAGEYFRQMIWTFIWAVPALICVAEFYLFRSPYSKLLALALFVEITSMITFDFYNYANACYRYYNHFVWNP
jgi:hypothetical protein